MYINMYIYRYIHLYIHIDMYMNKYICTYIKREGRDNEYAMKGRVSSVMTHAFALTARTQNLTGGRGGGGQEC